MFRILAVDDNPADVSLLREVLKTISRPYHMDWAKDGLEALEFLQRRPGAIKSRRPDLVLMDMNMPRVNGLEALYAMKSDPELSVIPVIILSTAAQPAEVRKCYQAHANCYLRKPANLEQSFRLAHAIEAFWMDFAVLPPHADGGIGPTHSSLPPRSSAPIATAGPSIARSMAEVSSQAARIVESPPAEAVSSLSTGCEEHRLLLEEFGAAVLDLLRLHEQQYRAIVQGDAESNRFDLLIHMANEKKQMAKYAYIHHGESHGCSNSDATNET